MQVGSQAFQGMLHLKRRVRQRTDPNPVHVYRCTHLIACRFKAKPATRMQGSFSKSALQSENLMSIIAWIILGLIAGFVASKIVNRTGEGVVLDVLLGIGGAVVGGWLFHTLGMRGVTGLNLYSMVVATIGAAVFLVVYHGLFRGFRFRRRGFRFRGL